MAISGLSGIGKTQIALQFAYFVHDNYPDRSIFWVQALSMEKFEQDYMKMARALNLLQGDEDKEAIKGAVQEHLSSKAAGKWLLIVDNADDKELLCGSRQAEGLCAFLPKSEDGLIVFTTQEEEIAQDLARSEVVDVSRMTQDEAVKLFKKSLKPNTPPSKDGLLEELLTQLEYLPLAITQAAAYINVMRSSISEYLRLLKKSEEDATILMNKGFGGEKVVAKTWTVTFNKIRQRNLLAVKLLEFISRIEWRAIPFSILPANQPEALFADAVGTLCSFSLVARRTDGEKLDMHRLVHLATRIWIKGDGRDAETSMVALKHLSKVFPSDDWRNRGKWRDYLPHAARIDDDENCKDTMEMSELDMKVGRCLYVDGRIKEAVMWLKKSCEWSSSHLAEDDEYRLYVQHELAHAYTANGQTEKAIAQLEKVVAIRTKTLKPGDPHLLASKHELAHAYLLMNKITEADELLEEVVEIRTNKLDKAHPDLLASKHELAHAYQLTGKAEKAIKVLEEVIAIRMNKLDKTHPDLLASKHELAHAYQLTGKTEEAIKVLEEVIAIRTNKLDKTHPDLLASKHELAHIYLVDGEFKMAIELLEEVVAIRMVTLDKVHPHLLTSKHELAWAYYNDGQLERAKELLEEVVTVRKSSLEEYHPNRRSSEDALAVIQQALREKNKSG
jgi:tetratricopeptide (TPR) repeat protein